MHEKYTYLRSDKDPYVNLDENSTAPIQREQWGLKDS